MIKPFLAALGLVIIAGAGCLDSITRKVTDTGTGTQTETSGTNLAGMSAEVNMPTGISVGDELTFEVEVKNSSTDVKYLRSIDIQNALLEGVLITSVYPDFDYEYPITDWYIYEFNQPVEGGDTMVVTFSAIALSAMDATGDFDICINDDGDCITVDTSLSIE